MHEGGAYNIPRYAEMRERSIMRQLALVGAEIVEAEGKVFLIAESTTKSMQGFLEMPVLLKEVVERIDILYSRENPDEAPALSTWTPRLPACTRET